MARPIVYVLGAVLTLAGLGKQAYGAFYVLLGSTFGDPGRVLVRMGLRGAAVGGVLLALGACCWLAAGALGSPRR